MTIPKNKGGRPRGRPTLWIRVDSSAPDDWKVAQVADELGVEASHAFGLCASVWCRMAEHAWEGELGAVPDAALERWAYWKGEPGAFARAFRAAYCDESGKVEGWGKRQQQLIALALKERERKQASLQPEASQPEPQQPKQARPAKKKRMPKDKGMGWLFGSEYADAWMERYDGQMNVGKWAHTLMALEDKYGHEEVMRRFKNMIARKQAEFATPATLKEGWGQWGFAAESGGAIVTPREHAAQTVYNLIVQHGLATCPPATLLDRIAELHAQGVIRDPEKFKAILQRLDFTLIRETRIPMYAHRHILERAGDLLVASA